MAHEHQRSDRDKYVRYDCENLPGIQELYEKAKAQQGDQLKDIKAFCEIPYLGVLYGSRHVDYTLGAALTSRWSIKNVGDYDMNSIMHYPTWIDASPACQKKAWESCAMVAWEKPEDHVWPHVKQIISTFAPSWSDAQWVKNTYPYIEK